MDRSVSVSKLSGSLRSDWVMLREETIDNVRPLGVLAVKDAITGACTPYRASALRCIVTTVPSGDVFVIDESIPRSEVATMPPGSVVCRKNPLVGRTVA